MGVALGTMALGVVILLGRHRVSRAIVEYQRSYQRSWWTPPGRNFSEEFLVFYHSVLGGVLLALGMAFTGIVISQR
jgi:uncharacterized BrkB/YihY/UPF0761 family membrane protein